MPEIWRNLTSVAVYQIVSAGVSNLQVFIGGLHQSHSSEDMEDAVGSLLYARNLRPVGAIRTIKELSRSIIEINEFFITSKIPTLTTIVQLYSGEEGTTAQVSFSWLVYLG